MTASTACRWPGRNPAKPNSSLSAPSTSDERATGTRGTRPSAAPRSSEVCRGGGGSSNQASDRGGRPYSQPPTAPRTFRTFVAEGCGSAANERERVLERVLGGGTDQRVGAAEARVAVRLARTPDRLIDAL